MMLLQILSHMLWTISQREGPFPLFEVNGSVPSAISPVFDRDNSPEQEVRRHDIDKYLCVPLA